MSSATASGCRSTAADGTFNPASAGVEMFGAIYSVESCSYDPERGVIVVPNRGVPQNVQTNNAWVSFINHDGSVHTARWIGVQNPADRANLTPRLVLNEPYGSDIAKGVLYLADRDGGTNPNDPSVAVIRTFDMKTGVPAVGGQTPDPATWQVWKIAADGTASMFVQGAPLRQPNGVAIDEKGNVVVLNMGTDEIRPGKAAELIASNIPNAASMCYDAGAKQLVIPMNPNNGLASVPIPK
jgi:hypothetical protein